MKAVTAAEMRSIEEQAGRQGLSISSLMQLAGQATAQAVHAVGKPGAVLILVGPGNNGGDGVVTARRLLEDGKDVRIYAFARQEIDDVPAIVAHAEHDENGQTLLRWLEECEVIVDALLGIGQHRPVAGLLEEMVRRVNDHRRHDSAVIAIDVPTGVDADTGRLLGDPVRADLTVCMGYLKPGVVSYPGAAASGDVVVRDLGIPRSLAGDAPYEYPEDADISALLPERKPNSNKGSFGRVLVAGGSSDFMGAPALVSLGAYRAGAGLLEVLVPHVVQHSVASHVMECIFSPGHRPGEQLGPACLPDFQRSMRKAQAVVFGPGMGLSDETKRLTQQLLEGWRDESPRGAVVDADALNALSTIDRWWEGIDNLVLTPHPGEMSRLTGLSVEAIQSERLPVALRFAREWGQVLVLKGAGTVVASPDGRASINPTGGANLATAGAGDVLSGIIGGLLAQGCPPWEAAVAGVYIHGRAGDIVREKLGDSGTLAGDLTGAVPLARTSLSTESRH